MSLFAPGRFVMTTSALVRIPSNDIVDAIIRHLSGDWGDVDNHDRKQNDLAVRNGGRLFSAYSSSNGTRFWVITESDRSLTTVLLPKDY